MLKDAMKRTLRHVLNRRLMSTETVMKRPHSRVLYDPKFTDAERNMVEKFESESGYETTRKALEEAWTIDPIVYKSEIFSRIEEKSVFGRAWTCVGLVDKLRHPGDTIRAKLGDSPIFITRDKKGNLNGFHNVCRHRGSLLVLEDGRYPVISCPYHRWGYSLDGRLLATPMWDMGPDGKTKNKSSRKRRREKNKEKLEELLSFADIKKIEDNAEECEQMGAIKQVFTPQGDFDKKDYPLYKVRVETWGPYVVFEAREFQSYQSYYSNHKNIFCVNLFIRKSLESQRLNTGTCLRQRMNMYPVSMNT